MTFVFGMTTVGISIRLLLHSQTCDRYNFNAVQCTLKPVSEVTSRDILTTGRNFSPSHTVTLSDWHFEGQQLQEAKRIVEIR